MPVESQSYYHPDTTEAPTAHGWTEEGTSGVLVDERWWTITTAVDTGYLFRPAIDEDPTPARGDDRLEIEAVFRGSTRNEGGGWSNASAHLLVLDDGERAIGLSIGDQLAFVDPTDGTVYLEISDSWGWQGNISYHLIKVGRTAWEAWADGQLIGRLAYNAVPAGSTFFPQAGYGWGWFDATGSSAGRWGHVETGLNRALPPDAVVDRLRLQAPALVQQNWNARWRAMFRAMAGLLHGAGDVSRRAYEGFTAGQIPWKEAEFTGEADARNAGWTYTDSGSISNVRERLRFVPSTTASFAEFDFGSPTNPAEAVHYARATFTLREWVSGELHRRVGPFLSVNDGNKQISVFLVAQDGNTEALGWVLSDGGLTGSLGVTGDRFARVNAYEAHTVELVVIALDRVILFVDERIVEDIPYDRFLTGSASTLARIGRSGSVDITCLVEVEDAYAYVAYADNSLRPWFVQRLAERLVFVSGCERNDRLDQWNRHRNGVMAVRGTDLVISEIRRVSCDDAAEMVTVRTPGDWFLEVSYPEVTPIFLEAEGSIVDAALEFEAGSPNFPPATLKKLIETYLLPRSVIESQFRALLRTFLTTDAATVGDETTFNVGNLTGFAIGDPIELRRELSGSLLDLDYDVGVSRTDEGIRDQSGNGRSGALVGVGGALSNAFVDVLATAIVDSVTPGVTGAQIRHTAGTPSFAGGMTYAGWFRWTTVASIVHLTATEDPTADGGWFLRKIANGRIVLDMYDAAGVSVGQIDVLPAVIAVGTWRHLAFSYDPAAVGTEIELYVDGVSVGTSAATAPPAVASGGLAVGGSWSSAWFHDHRDHWLWERAVGAAEVLAHSTTERITTPRNLFERATGDLPWLVYLWDGYAAANARYEPDPILPELQYVESFDDRVWAPWASHVDGQKRREVVGQVTVTGLATSRLANITAGSTVTIVGDSAASVGWVEVFGTQQGTGNELTERLELNGTTPVVGTILWAASGVHGGALDRLAGDEVRIRDTVAAVDLYVIAVGARASGVHVFDPPLRAGAVELAYRALAASTETFLVAGHVVGGGDEVGALTLAGTTPQASGAEWYAIRALAVGYVLNATSIRADAVLTDPTGTLTVVSNSAADVMGAFAVGLGPDGLAFVEALALDGTTPVTGTGAYVRFLGIVLSQLGTGVVTVTLEGGSVDVTVATFDASERDAAGGRRFTAGVVGALEATPSEDLSPAGRVAYYGLDENNQLTAVAVELAEAGTWLATTGAGWLELRGILTGDIVNTAWVSTRGTAWRADGAYEAIQAFAGYVGWSGALAGALDAVVDDNTLQDLSVFLTIGLEGHGSVYEDTEILDLDLTTSEVTVPALDGTFVTGDIMRKSAQL